MSTDDANATLDRLNRALAELGMPAAALTVTWEPGVFGRPEAVVRLALEDEPETWYGEIRIKLRAVHDA